jgi:hypothetical protein
MHQRAAVLWLALQLASAAVVDLGQECPGNLLLNAGFEEPNTETTPTQIWEPTSNSKWGWYDKIPGVQPFLIPCLVSTTQLIGISVWHGPLQQQAAAQANAQ